MPLTIGHCVNAEECDTRPPVGTRVAEELERILATQEFRRAPQLGRFLRYVVEETVEGRGDRLKEYVIGVKVYGRGEKFDPRLDPIVRVQAGKLRARLAAYYAGVGAGRVLRIELPKGSYVPVFRESRPASGFPVWGRGAVTSLLIAAAAGLLIWRAGHERGSSPPLTWHALTQESGWAGHPAISRDGALMVYASDQDPGGSVDIWLRDLRTGAVRRLSTHPAIDFAPDISSDGTRVVFRSFRLGGGVYSVPASGGVETLLAAGGFTPRFSPDGRWVAFNRIDEAGNGTIYVVPSGGGTPRRVHTQRLSTMCPLWGPDGRNLFFEEAVNDSRHDWWVVPFDPATSTPVAARRTNWSLHGPSMGSCTSDWLDAGIVAAKWNGIHRVSPKGDILVEAPGIETLRSAVWPDGRRGLIFSQGQRLNHLWTIPLGRNGEASGEPRRLARHAPDDPRSGLRISRDGRRVTVLGDEAGAARRVYLCDLDTGAERAVSPARERAGHTVMTADGRRLAWLVEQNRASAIVAASSDDPWPARLCSGCGVPRTWSSDGRILLYTDGPDLWSLDVETGARKPLLQRQGYEVTHAAFSPDGRWLALVVGVAGAPKLQGVVVRADANLADQRHWVPIVEEPYGLALEWGARGDGVYYLSRKWDDFRCLYLQRLQDRNKKPDGPPVAVRHFHTYQRSPVTAGWLAVASDKVVLALTSPRSNIWRVDLPR